ncbi:MAG: bifunctional 23S rRNA (guanine(2069)-N(7))-methyltransferase RlmK/23S rRNA (guanine(2445)-N(2))-methyltransferase RlmL [Gammaproteobacteria bacterium]
MIRGRGPVKITCSLARRDHNRIRRCRAAILGNRALATYHTHIVDKVIHLNTPHRSEGAQMFANRLLKNQKHLAKWCRREQVSCYRLYDADMPEYALAVDIYASATEPGRRWVHVQEYEAPKKIPADKAQQRLDEALQVIREELAVAASDITLKVRRQQKGTAQYEKLAEQKKFYEVAEAGNRFWVNFSDYLDTGLFLDHRLTRGLLAELAAGRRFLNLFAYTGSGTVYAARGGASATTTVDMSRTYLDWARRNMQLNGFDTAAHEYVQANCIEWLQQAAGQALYELIFLDPPSFSTSKRMDATFDVQRDHVMLLRATAKLLAPEGVLIFSNNLRSFKMDRAALPELDIQDISRATLPKDFERNPKIHNCWRIRHRHD